MEIGTASFHYHVTRHCHCGNRSKQSQYHSLNSPHIVTLSLIGYGYTLVTILWSARWTANRDPTNFPFSFLFHCCIHCCRSSFNDAYTIENNSCFDCYDSYYGFALDLLLRIVYPESILKDHENRSYLKFKFNSKLEFQIKISNSNLGIANVRELQIEIRISNETTGVILFASAIEACVLEHVGGQDISDKRMLFTTQVY